MIIWNQQNQQNNTQKHKSDEVIVITRALLHSIWVWECVFLSLDRNSIYNSLFEASRICTKRSFAQHPNMKPLILL